MNNNLSSQASFCLPKASFCLPKPSFCLPKGGLKERPSVSIQLEDLAFAFSANS